MIIKIGSLPFPAARDEFGYVAKIKHIWHCAQRDAKMHDYRYENCYGVIVLLRREATLLRLGSGC